MGAGFGAWIVNNIDIAPNHCGPIMGVANSLSNCLGFIAPYVTGLILHANVHNYLRILHLSAIKR